MKKIRIYEENEIKKISSTIDSLNICLSCINLNPEDELTKACNPNFLKQAKDLIKELRKDLQIKKTLSDIVEENQEYESL